MRQKSERHQGAAERTIKDIRRRTRKRHSSEEKIRIVLAGLRGEAEIDPPLLRSSKLGRRWHQQNQFGLESSPMPTWTRSTLRLNNWMILHFEANPYLLDRPAIEVSF
jgi:hypothetical protein